MHLNALPKDLIVEIIADFVKEQRVERKIANYEDWLVASYGRKFAELFPMTYTRKYHLTTPSNMSTDWLGPRMYRPSLEELLRGALAPWTPESHYITQLPLSDATAASFRTCGDLPADRRHQARPRTSWPSIPRQKTLRFANGVYDRLRRDSSRRSRCPICSR